MKEYNKILNYYVTNYYDTTLEELEKAKQAIETPQDLINYLSFAIEHNYYTGHYWSNLYNFNNELEETAKELIDNESYLNYLVDYSDRHGDIFIIANSEELIAREKANKDNPINMYVLEYYDELQPPEVFQNITYYNENDILYLIDELYQIPERLEPFINYNHIIEELTQDECYIEYGNGIIFDENRT